MNSTRLLSFSRTRTTRQRTIRKVFLSTLFLLLLLLLLPASGLFRAGPLSTTTTTTTVLVYLKRHYYYSSHWCCCSCWTNSESDLMTFKLVVFFFSFLPPLSLKPKAPKPPKLFIADIDDPPKIGFGGGSILSLLRHNKLSLFFLSSLFSLFRCVLFVCCFWCFFFLRACLFIYQSREESKKCRWWGVKSIH